MIEPKPSLMPALLPEWQDVAHPVIGMVHAPPLPGSPRFGGHWEAIEAHVLADVDALVSGGVAILMLENFGDTPFYPESVPATTIAALTRLACAITQRTSLPLGINVLRNDGSAALAIATVSGARFIRVNVLTGARVADQGLITGQAHRLLRERAALGANDIRVLADVDVKHSAPLARRSLTEETHDLVLRGGADGVVVSGSATGRPINLAELTEVQAAAAGRPVFLGSGVTVETIKVLKPHCQGVIVGTSLKHGGVSDAAVDPIRVADFVAAIHS